MAGQQDPSPVVLTGQRLSREFFDRDAVEVAGELLGRVLVCGAGGAEVAVRLTEVEAYRGEGRDPASHAHRGRTPRNAVMFGPPGFLYTYFTYGMHWCANLVCGPGTTASAVLLRAGEVLSGLEVARGRRPAAKREVDLARGPARLASALGLGRADNGRDVCAEPAAGLALYAGSPPDPAAVSWGPRVGVNVGVETPFRAWIAGEPSVSAFRPGKPRRRRAPV